MLEKHMEKYGVMKLTDCIQKEDFAYDASGKLIRVTVTDPQD